MKKENVLPVNNVGIHWFNGATKSKQYAIDLDKRIDNTEFTITCYLDKFVSEYISGTTENTKNIENAKNIETSENIETPENIETLENIETSNQVKIPRKEISPITKHKKVSIVTAYYNRKEQLIQTLKSIRNSSYKDFELIIVDDNSDPGQRVDEFINAYKGNLDVKVITIEQSQKTWVNPCIPYNIGFREAVGDIIIIQNPEVMHVGDCISYVADHLEYGDWLSFNCYGSPGFNYNHILYKKTDLGKYKKISMSRNRIGGNSVARNNVGGWLNHFDKHFVAYHYCGAIHRKDLFERMNGGFNEDFQNGIGGDDDEFIKRLIYNGFKFKINRFKQNEPFVIHQFHEKPKQLKRPNKNNTNNRQIFNQYCKKMGFKEQNDISLAPKREIPMFRRVLL
jgi:glycosyltransferase involved in cell wall biosynthesis